MVENPSTAMASGLATAQAVDTELRKRLGELAKRGKDDPGSLCKEEIQELCASMATLLGEETS